MDQRRTTFDSERPHFYRTRAHPHRTRNYPIYTPFVEITPLFDNIRTRDQRWSKINLTGQYWIMSDGNEYFIELGEKKRRGPLQMHYRQHSGHTWIRGYLNGPINDANDASAATNALSISSATAGTVLRPDAGIGARQLRANGASELSGRGLPDADDTVASQRPSGAFVGAGVAWRRRWFDAEECHRHRRRHLRVHSTERYGRYRSQSPTEYYRRLVHIWKMSSNQFE